jgi:hypothetical protein
MGRVQDNQQVGENKEKYGIDVSHAQIFDVLCAFCASVFYKNWSHSL